MVGDFWSYMFLGSRVGLSIEIEITRVLVTVIESVNDKEIAN